MIKSAFFAPQLFSLTCDFQLLLNSGAIHELSCFSDCIYDKKKQLCSKDFVWIKSFKVFIGNLFQVHVICTMIVLPIIAILNFYD